MDLFDGTEVKIGRGAQAMVYLYRGEAYKVFREGYPSEWVAAEYDKHRLLMEANVPMAQYYEILSPGIIRMEYVEGKTLAEQVSAMNYQDIMKSFMNLQEEIHMYKGLTLQSVIEFMQMFLQGNEEVRQEVNSLMSDIPQGDSLLHMDYHYKNILSDGVGYRAIDWMNACIGSPVYDYARSYVIMQEFASDVAEDYRRRLEDNKKIKCHEFDSAVKIMTLIRSVEKEQ